MAAKYKDEAERWKRRLEESEAVNARLRQELMAVEQAVQQMYSAGAALTSLAGTCSASHPVTPPDSLEAGQAAD